MNTTLTVLPRAFDDAGPVPADSPWPTFRRDARNTGRSPLRAVYAGDQPWQFATGKGIFSTPIIDGAGGVYVGSADHTFYALTPDGRERWRCVTGEIIDSAGALLAGGRVVFPSGDGRLRCLQCANGALLWSFDARTAPRASYNNWWEGNVAVGPDGTLYAGNTNFNYYAVTPEGRLKWTYPTGANAWSCAAFAADGTIYWGSNDTLVRAVAPDGRERWRARTLGFIAASAAVGTDGTLYIGSFDSYFYALAPATGRVLWKFRTGDHIYSSAAVGADGSLYVGSTDGGLYALTPDGRLRWRYEAGAPIRSSPVLGRAPAGEGWIVYVGAGDGRLHAVEAADGAPRWRFDTTPADPELRDRNDLNGSPALGRTGVYIGGEHGQLWYVPYDYPLHHPGERAQAGAPAAQADGAVLVYVSPGGNVRPHPPALPAASLLTFKLQVRQGGASVPARLYRAPLIRPRSALSVRAEPAFPFRCEVSADGRYLHVFPQGFLTPGQTYSLHLDGAYYTGGWAFGNLSVGGRRAGRFHTTFTFAVEPPESASLPLAGGDEATTGAVEWTRLAVPVPTMLPSLNQIGFDYMDWIVGVLDRDDTQGRLIAWAVGARRDAAGQLAADPASDFRLPLSGPFQADAFILANRDFRMAVTGIPIPFQHFELRGRLGSDGRVRPGATTYGETSLLGIPTFGPLLALAGLGTNLVEKLLTVGTYITRPYAGPANRRPAGVRLAGVEFEPPLGPYAGRVTARVAVAPGAAYPLAEHLPGLVLVDAAAGEVVPLDYHGHLTAAADAAGDLAAVTLTVPAGRRLPAALDVIVILDVFPLARVRVR